jgi:hypothetical protein
MSVSGTEGPRKPEVPLVSTPAPIAVSPDTRASSIKGAGPAAVTAAPPLAIIPAPAPVDPLPGSNPADPISPAELHVSLGIAGFETAYMLAWAKDAEESRGHHQMKTKNQDAVVAEWSKEFSLINVGAGNFVKELAKLIALILEAAAASEQANITQMAKTGAVVLEAAKNAGDAIRNVAEKKGLAGIIAGSVGVAAGVASFTAGAVKGSWTELGKADAKVSDIDRQLGELETGLARGKGEVIGPAKVAQQTQAGGVVEEPAGMKWEEGEAAHAKLEEAAGRAGKRTPESKSSEEVASRETAGAADKKKMAVKPDKSPEKKRLEGERKTAKKKLDELTKKRSELGTMIGQMGQAAMTIGPAAAEFMTKDDQALAQRLQGYANVLNLLMNLFLKSCESAAQNFSTEVQSNAQMEAQAAKAGILGAA